MPDIQEINHFFRDTCPPLRNVINYAYVSWCQAEPFKILGMPYEQANVVSRRVKKAEKGGAISTWEERRGQERSWDAVMDMSIEMASTFYNPTVDQLGIYYEQWIRSLMGLHTYIWRHKKQIGEESLCWLQVNSGLYTEQCRNACLEVWALPGRIKNKSEVDGQLKETGNIQRMLNFFLENAPIMQTFYTARESSNNERVTRVVTEQHYAKSGLLYFVTKLLQEAAGDINARGDLVAVNRHEDYVSQFPDRKRDEYQYMTEFALNIKSVIVDTPLESIRNQIGNNRGWQKCMAEVLSGGKSTSKIRAQIVQLLILSNTFPQITDDFFSIGPAKLT